MKNWDIKRLYFYLVCFATLLMTIMGTFMFLQNVVDVVYPYKYYDELMYYDGKMTADMTAEERAQWEAEQEKRIQAQRENEKHNRVRQLLDNLIMVGVAFPVYLYHWRRVQSLDKDDPKDMGA